MKRIFKQIAFVVFTLSIVSLSCKKKEDPEPNPKPHNPAPMMSNPEQGQPYATGKVDAFTLVSNGYEVLLAAVNNTTGKIYLVDLKDKNAGLASANAINGTVTTVRQDIAQILGISATAVVIKDIEINPVSKSVYILVGQGSVFKLQNGKDISIVDMSNVSYCTITFSGSGKKIQDITWGDNTLYLSIGQVGTLNSEVAKIGSPFTHNSSVTNRMTSMYKTNWGGGYHTDAPLERMAYTEISGSKRLVGVTVCAPGFSFETNEIEGSGTLTVKEYFNLGGMYPVKVETINQNSKTYLIALHATGLFRIGQHFIDGTPTQFNATAKYLTNAGTIMQGLTDEDVKKYTGTFKTIAKYSDTQLLIVDGSSSLSLLAL